jgi:lipopolysaccharide/colanic/teichoic acid biosynthesis glycosyltransferase
MLGERTRELALLLAGDVLILIVAYIATPFVRYLTWPPMERFTEYLGPFALMSLIWIFVFYLAGLYGKHTTFLKKSLQIRLVKTQLINLVVGIVFLFLLPGGSTPQWILSIFVVISLGLLTLWRVYLFPGLTTGSQLKALLLADGEAADELVSEVNSNQERYSYYFARAITAKDIEEDAHLICHLMKFIRDEDIKVIVADLGSPHIEELLPSIFDHAFMKFRFSFFDFNKVYEETFDRVSCRSLNHDWFLANVSQSRAPFYEVSKRIIDVVLALMLAVPSLALFPFVALAIKLEDGGPIFYKTERVGRFNKVIHLYKYRTKNGADSGDTALKSELVDTRIGAFLRKSRIDELPQLINVLKGDLSFIGPRPEMPALAKVYAEQIPFYSTRHFIKPGLSGWAQINEKDAPRGGIDLERTSTKLSYDLFYLKRHSLLLDLQTALRTITTLLERSGR